MKFLVVIAAAVAVASAAALDESSAPVLKSDFDVSPEGNFQYSYETGNGINAAATGNVKNINSEYPAIAIQGGYKYTAPDGTPVEVSYVADENGYQPQGNLLPVGPPIPEAIVRSLAWIAAHPPQPEKPSTRFKFLVVLAVAVACASADVSHVVKDEAYAPIVKSSYDISPDGEFQYNFETANGIYAQAEGSAKNVNAEYPAVQIVGGYKYTAPDGQVIDTAYKADENGFQAQGSHIPVAPPTPEPILRALAWIAAHPAQVEKAVNGRYA